MFEHVGSGRPFFPAWRAIIGRAPTAALVLEDPSVSGEHATVFWTGSSWMLRDLGSRNGTWVGERRLEPGDRVELQPGDSVRFGHPDQVWKLVDALPPGAMAIDADGTTHRAVDGLLALPDEEHAQLVIFETGRGWILEDDGAPEPVRDGDVVSDGTNSWTVHLPQAGGPLAATREVDGTTPAIGEIALTVRVSSDEEYVEVDATLPDRSVKLAPRAYHDLILVLARMRIRDRDTHSPAEQGWIYFDDFCQMLGRERNRVNVDVFRARKQFAELGIQGAADVIERRATTRQIRLGVGHVEVRPL